MPLVADPFCTQELAEKDVRKRIGAIEDEIHLGREKAFADAVYYARIKEAESNDRLLTDNFLEYTRILRQVVSRGFHFIFFLLTAKHEGFGEAACRTLLSFGFSFLP